MTLHLYCHPFSSFCQKTLMAFYEKQVDFTSHVIDLSDERSRTELLALWPYGKFPVLHDTVSGMTMAESSPIIEYVDASNATGPRLVPADPASSRGVRLWDRILDNYLHLPLQKIVADRLRPAGAGDAFGVAEARNTLAITYRMLERALVQGPWLFGDFFTLADCAAAPPLFYAERVAPFRADHPKLAAYFARLLARPSFARCVEEAREYRHFFPAAEDDAGWPDEAARVAF
jgi:glutathione S-transferase